jgi:hypothetical protein
MAGVEQALSRLSGPLGAPGNLKAPLAIDGLLAGFGPPGPNAPPALVREILFRIESALPRLEPGTGPAVWRVIQLTLGPAGPAFSFLLVPAALTGSLGGKAGPLGQGNSLPGGSPAENSPLRPHPRDLFPFALPGEEELVPPRRALPLWPGLRKERGEEPAVAAGSPLPDAGDSAETAVWALCSLMFLPLPAVLASSNRSRRGNSGRVWRDAARIT